MSASSTSRMEMMEAAFVANEDGNLFVQLADAYRDSGDDDRAKQDSQRRRSTPNPDAT